MNDAWGHAPWQQNWDLKINQDNPDLYENGNLKTNKLIRATSDNKLKQELKFTNRKFISESQKFKHISTKGDFVSDILGSLFKYFSQFYHYSPKTIEFIENDSQLDLSQYSNCMKPILYLLQCYFECLNFNNPELLKTKFNQLEKILLKDEY